MKYFKLFILINLILFVYSCGTIKEGFSNQKKNSSDEFLVEKKTPLILPPDFDELPAPQSSEAQSEKNKNSIETLITNNQEKENKDDNQNILNKSLEESFLEKIKNN